MVDVNGQERCWEAYRDSGLLPIDESASNPAERNENAKPTGHQRSAFFIPD